MIVVDTRRLKSKARTRLTAIPSPFTVGCLTGRFYSLYHVYAVIWSTYRNWTHSRDIEAASARIVDEHKKEAENALKRKFQEIMTESRDVVGSYNDLQEDFLDLKEEYDELKKQLKEAKREISDLDGTNRALLAGKEALEVTNRMLSNDKAVLEASNLSLRADKAATHHTSIIDIGKFVEE